MHCDDLPTHGDMKERQWSRRTGNGGGRHKRKTLKQKQQQKQQQQRPRQRRISQVRIN